MNKMLKVSNICVIDWKRWLNWIKIIKIKAVVLTTAKKAKWQKNIKSETNENIKKNVNWKNTLMCISYCMIIVTANSYWFDVIQIIVCLFFFTWSLFVCTNKCTNQTKFVNSYSTEKYSIACCHDKLCTAIVIYLPAIKLPHLRNTHIQT